MRLVADVSYHYKLVPKLPISERMLFGKCYFLLSDHKMKSVLLQLTADRYDELIATPNLNKAEADTVEARSVAAALSVLKVGDEAEEDKHPERFAATDPTLQSLLIDNPACQAQQVPNIQFMLLIVLYYSDLQIQSDL